MELIKHTKFLDFKSAKSPSGHDWFYVHRTNDALNHDSAVVITTLIKNKNGKYDFLLFKTSRPPITAQNKAKYCIETPAGLIGDVDCDENLLECVNKELLEETGYKADKIYIEALNYSTSSGLTSETLSFVTAIINEDKLTQNPIDDGGVIVERFRVGVDEIFDYIKSVDNKTISFAIAAICGIYFGINRINMIR